MQLNLFLPRAKGSRASSLGRRILRRLGPSWEATPVRRLAQALSLLLFLLLLVSASSASGSLPLARLRSFIPTGLFLALDPLVSVSAAIAARTWVWSLVGAGAVLLLGVFLPRGFCGYLCPLGSLTDLFDWALGRRVRGLRLRHTGGWVYLRYFLLAALIAAALIGVLLTGFLAALPLVTRGLVHLLGPLGLGLLKGWRQTPPMDAGEYVAIGLLLGVLALGFLGPRFWCRHLCPTGALLSMATLFRAAERTVGPRCAKCGRCIEACQFGAVRPDYGTRASNCTFCQTCASTCPTGAINFARRGGTGPAAEPIQESPSEPALSRRRFLAGSASALVVAAGGRALWRTAGAAPVVRPPGSVPEATFLRLCVRCGECLQACPTKVLQPAGLVSGWEGLWSPRAATDRSGCDPECANCGQVCPTGAIRSLPLAEKRVARMGLAAVNTSTCLPHAGREACQLCVDQCRDAGYHAIEFLRVGVQVDAEGMPVDESGFLAPVVVAERCVGCGLCQSRCYAINVGSRGVLSRAAIEVAAGPGREDRLLRGSYLALREQERQAKAAAQEKAAPPADTYLPDFLR